MESGKFEIPSTLEDNYETTDDTKLEEKSNMNSTKKKRSLPDWLAEKPDSVQPRTSHESIQTSKIVITKTSKIKNSNQIHYIMNDEDLVDIAKKYISKNYK